MQPLPKLIITGYKRHGKDTVCELMKPYGFSFMSSSMAVCEEVIFPAMKVTHSYQTVEDCYNDRDNWRPLWFKLISEYNTPDLARLGRRILSKHDIYAGLRKREELVAQQKENVFDFMIWVDALDRKEPESSDSMTITKEDAHYILDNNGPEEDLPYQIEKMLNEFLWPAWRKKLQA